MRKFKHKENDTVNLQLRIPESLRNRLAAIAKREMRSLNGQIVYLLTQVIKEQGDD